MTVLQHGGHGRLTRAGHATHADDLRAQRAAFAAQQPADRVWPHVAAQQPSGPERRACHQECPSVSPHASLQMVVYEGRTDWRRSFCGHRRQTRARASRWAGTGRARRPGDRRPCSVRTPAAGPGGSKAAKSAALQAATSSPGSSGWAPSLSQSHIGSAEPARAARRALRRRASQPRDLRRLRFDHAAGPRTTAPRSARQAPCARRAAGCAGATRRRRRRGNRREPGSARLPVCAWVLALFV